MSHEQIDAGVELEVRAVAGDVVEVDKRPRFGPRGAVWRSRGSLPPITRPAVPFAYKALQDVVEVTHGATAGGVGHGCRFRLRMLGGTC